MTATIELTHKAHHLTEGKHQMSATGNGTEYKFSYRDIMRDLGSRYKNLHDVDLMEQGNETLWGVYQLADAIIYDGLTLTDPMFAAIEGDTIRERCRLDGIEYDLTYKIQTPDSNRK